MGWETATQKHLSACNLMAGKTVQSDNMGSAVWYEAWRRACMRLAAERYDMAQQLSASPSVVEHHIFGAICDGLPGLIGPRNPHLKGYMLVEDA